MLQFDTVYGMFRRTEVCDAKDKPIPDCIVARRIRGVVAACHEIYVTVLSGRSRQDDPPRGRGLGQRRDRVVLAYAARNREPVTQALFRTALGGVGGSDAPGSPPGFFPQRSWCRSRPWRV